MLPSIDVCKAAGFASVHSLALFVWSVALIPFLNVDPLFWVEAMALNGYMVRQSNAYLKTPSVDTARSLFRYSILYLTILMLLMMWSRTDRPTPLLQIPGVLLDKALVACSVLKKGCVKLWGATVRVGRFVGSLLPKLPVREPPASEPPTWSVSE